MNKNEKEKKVKKTNKHQVIRKYIADLLNMKNP